MWCDTISMPKDLIDHGKIKYFDIDRNFINQKLEGRELELTYLPNGRQVTECLLRHYHDHSLKN